MAGERERAIRVDKEEGRDRGIPAFIHVLDRQ